MVLFIAVGSAILAVGGIATGQVLLGVVALLSAGWLGSMSYVSLTAWSRLDEEGLRSHWMRATQLVRWDEMTEIEIDRRAPHGALRTVEAVRTDGAAARWAPWYPFLWYAHHSVSTSLPDLTAAAEAHGVTVRVLENESPRGPA
jgi:hypothetical protein